MRASMPPVWGEPDMLIDVTSWGPWPPDKWVVGHGARTFEECQRLCGGDDTCLSHFSFRPSTDAGDDPLTGACVTETSQERGSQPQATAVGTQFAVERDDVRREGARFYFATVGGFPKAYAKLVAPTATCAIDPDASGTTASGGVPRTCAASAAGPVHASDWYATCRAQCEDLGDECGGFVVDATGKFCAVLPRADEVKGTMTRDPAALAANPNRFFTYLRPRQDTAGVTEGLMTITVDGHDYVAGRWREPRPQMALLVWVFLAAVAVGGLCGWGAWKLGGRLWPQRNMAQELTSDLGAMADDSDALLADTGHYG